MQLRPRILRLIICLNWSFLKYLMNLENMAKCKDLNQLLRLLWATLNHSTYGLNLMVKCILDQTSHQYYEAYTTNIWERLKSNQIKCISILKGYKTET